MSNRIAAQLYTVREFTKTAEQFDETLEILHGIGFAGVQLSAVACMSGENPEVSATKAREMLDSHGLVCAATHRDWASLRDRTEQEIEFHSILGCGYTAIGGLWGANDDPAKYREFVEESKPVAERLQAAGIWLGYHNHAHEFIVDRSTGKSNYDVIFEAKHLMLEIDTYWIQHAGLDPAQFLRRAANRIQVIHVKDKEVVPGEGPVMAPVGEGNLDWDGIIAAGEEGGVEWYAIEQDVCRRDPFDCLASSFEFLAAKGLAD
jgi:sugar phosphate isomerase/epimerase